MALVISLVILVFYTTSNTVKGQAQCEQSKLCVFLKDCPDLFSLISKKHRNPQEVEFLQKAHCGFEGKKPKVCCDVVDKHVEPDENATGPCKCLPLSECPSLLAITKKQKRTKEDLETLRNSTCGFEGYNPMVCCKLSICEPSETLPDRSSECCGRYSAKANRIIIFGGTALSVDQYPWLAYIDYLQLSGNDQGKNKFMCGGVLISSKYVMTAAHCVVGSILNLATPIDVRLGEYDIISNNKECFLRNGGEEGCGKGLVIIPIKKTIPHPMYDTQYRRRHDIALVKMTQLAPYNDIIRPICLPNVDITAATSKPETNYTFKSAAWGKIDENIFGSKIKLFEEVEYKSLAECQSFYKGSRRIVELWDGHICAGSGPYKDPCKNDAGGPLMYENNNVYEVLGVASFGATCGFRPSIPNVYTKVFNYVPWIRSVILGETGKD